MLINSFGKNFDVTALIRNENNFSIIDKDLNFKIIKTDKESIKELRSKKFDVYINLISSSKKIRNFKDLGESLNSNIFLNKKILKILFKLNINNIIQVNSYWQLLKRPGLKKISIYFFGKTHITNFLERNKNKKFSNLNTIYVGDLYGKNDFRKKLIPMLLNDNNLEIKNTNNPIFPNHIEEVITALENIILKNNKSGNYYSFTECMTVKDVARIIKRLPNFSKEISDKHLSDVLNLESINLINDNEKTFLNRMSEIR